MVLGLPIGRIVGQYFGWRTTVAIGIGALVTLVCLIKLLPALPSEHSGSLKSLPLLTRCPALLSIYLLTVISWSPRTTRRTATLNRLCRWSRALAQNLATVSDANAQARFTIR